MKTIDNYLELLNHSFEVKQNSFRYGQRSPSKLEFLARHVFGFITYDPSMSERFAAKAVDVCAAISDRKVDEFNRDPEQYQWFLMMCNTPFFADRLEWGSAIHGAWWSGSKNESGDIELESTGLYVGDEQLTDPIRFNDAEWKDFIAAVVDFGQAPKPHHKPTPT